MPEVNSRPLHLHTLDSLMADLVSGRPIETNNQDTFILQDQRTRSALDWYRKKGGAAWTASVSAANGEDLVDAILLAPPELPALPARHTNAKSRRLTLKKLEAHRFAGLHKFGTPDAPPANYIHNFTSRLTLFEGRNGSGKTSLLNAIIWTLTGEMLRPQREPETAEDFDCWVSSGDEDGVLTAHKLSSVTPMPIVDQYRPDQPWVPADTWVELTFVDETGVELPVIRRSQGRSPQGKLKETPPDLTVLDVDPIAIRIGSVMPGLLSLIKVGSESELGKAVSQLTGLSALVDLAEHVRRAKAKIEKEFVKAKNADLDQADRNYGTAKNDLEKVVLANPSLTLPSVIPIPSDDKRIEHVLDEISAHFANAKAAAFQSAREILGENFDPADPKSLSSLEKNIGGALERASRPQELTSGRRLGRLRQLTSEELSAAEDEIQSILSEANTLDALAKNPSEAARTRLYARVATWIADHPDPNRKDDDCVVCGGNLSHSVDPVTARPVQEHMHEAAGNATLLSQTLFRWAESAVGNLMRNLPETLRTESATDLPNHPCDLLRSAIVDELFAFDPFKGVLSELSGQTGAAFDAATKDRAPLAEPIEIVLPKECVALTKALKRLDCAIRFARWRQENDILARGILASVLGQVPKEGEQGEKRTLIGKLLDLNETVKAAQPVSDALVQCGRLKDYLKSRRAAEKRLGDYAIAIQALSNLASLGNLADEQVNQLRDTLRKDAAEWRSRIYLGSYPDTAHELVDTAMGRKGELNLFVETGGVSAPAQHVTNASALRASLVAFFLAFWTHVLRERGGLTTLILDDPQELLDDENKERLASTLAQLNAANAQLIVSSYDARFCSRVSRLPVVGGVEHLEVHPATRQQPVVRTTPPLPEIQDRLVKFQVDRNAEEPARNFADGCRVFFEAKLGDMFDDPAHAAWSIANPDPTLATFIQRLRPLVKAAPQGMFSANIFTRFVDHPSLTDLSPVIVLMNKAHHGRRQEIRAADVAQCADDLSTLLEIVEKMSEECYRWKRRDNAKDQPKIEMPVALVPMARPALNIMICPDLAAFTQNAPSSDSQDSLEQLDPKILDNKVVYYLRRHNFGFAAPSGSLSIVEAIPGPSLDRQLVVARQGDDVYARRLVRAAKGEVIGLTADIPDPRSRTPKTIFFHESAVAIHQVVGIIFDHSVVVGHGKDEATQIDASNELKRIEIAFRVVDDSAVPLALENQVVLGGSRIELDQIGQHKDALVALALDDGSSIFKRVGTALPGDLAHLRQFESIGGLGSSQILSIGKQHHGFRTVTNVRIIIGVLYNV